MRPLAASNPTSTLYKADTRGYRALNPVLAAASHGSSQHLQQPTDSGTDLDLIDSLFDSAAGSTQSTATQTAAAAPSAQSAARRMLEQRRKQLEASAAASAAAATKQVVLPKRASSLPWGQSGKAAADAAVDEGPASPATSTQGRSSPSSGSSSRAPIRRAGKTSSTCRSSSSIGLGNDQLYPTAAENAAPVPGLPVVNPWAAEQAARRQRANPTAARLAPRAATAWADVELEAELEAVDDDLQKGLQAAEAEETEADRLSPLFRWPLPQEQQQQQQSSWLAQPQQQPQQQQQQPLRQWQPPNNPVLSAHRPQLPARPVQQQWQQDSSLAASDAAVQQDADSSMSTWEESDILAAYSQPSGSAEDFAAVQQQPPLQDARTAQQQWHSRQEQQPVNMEGVVRSSRRLKVQQRQQQRQQRQLLGVLQQQQLLRPPTQTGALGAAAQSVVSMQGVADSPAAAADIGRMPLVVPGAQARGDQVVWQQGPPPMLQQQQQGSPPASISQEAASTGSSSSSSSKGRSRIRRVRRGALQGAVLTTPAPDVQTPSAGAAAAAAPAPAAARFTDEVGATPSTSSSSSSRGRGSSLDPQQLQQQLATLDHSNWRQQAEQLLPQLYDPSWHSSMYTLMLDVWPAALAAAGAEQPVTPAVPQAAPLASLQQQQQQPGITVPGAGAPVVLQWAQACVNLQQQQRYIWCSAVLALIDCLADNEALRLPQAAAAVPLEVLVSRVLPAAAVVDEDLSVGLQETVQKLLQQQRQHQLLQQQQLPLPLLETSALSGGGKGADETQAAAAGAAQAEAAAEGLSSLARLANAAAAAAGLAGKSSAGRKQQWQQQQQQLLIAKPQQQQTTSEPAATPATAAVASEGAAQAPQSSSDGTRFEMVDALAELASLQGTYPGVQMSALAHVADAHGIWA